ncbi:MAG: sugar phosphate nucleotidyltransferase [Brevinema sp.]
MKIVLPLAGKGTRLHPHTLKTPKPLMEVAGKSILAHLMDELITLNPSEFVFVVGYLQDQIRAFIKEHYPNIPVRFVEQIDPKGLGHAILCAQPAFTNDEPMLVILGDQTFTIPWDKMLEPTSNRISTFKVEDPSSFGVVLTNAEGRVIDMEEKPAKPKSDMIISGTYFFLSAHQVFQTLEKQVSQNICTRGEIQITDTMRLMMDEGNSFMSLPIDDWNDCGNHEDLIKANEVLLSKQQTKTLIDPTAIVENCVIGSNVSIGANVVVKNCTLSNTVVCKGTHLENCVINESYITENINGGTHQKCYC